MMSGKSPVITTVIPTFRRPQLLRRALASVLRQTFKDFQVIVYDNASGDETADVVAEMARKDSRVKYHCHNRNIGALLNFQYAMKHIETPFFSMLSDDDIVLPDFFVTALDAFEAYPDAMFAATRVIGMDQSGKFYPMHEITAFPRYYEPPQGLIAMLKHGHPTWTGILFRKEIVVGLGGLDITTGAAADGDFEFRAASTYPFVALDKVCAIFSCHDISLTASARLGSTWPGWLKMIDNLASSKMLDKKSRLFVRENLTKRLQQRLISITIGSLARENFADSQQAIDILVSHFGRNGIALILRAITFGVEESPTLLAFLKKLFLIRRKLRTRRMKTMSFSYNESESRISEAVP